MNNDMLPTNDEVYAAVCKARGMYVSTNAVNDVMAAVRALTYSAAPSPTAPERSGESADDFTFDDLSDGEAAISAAMSEGNKFGVKSTVAARIVAAYLNATAAHSSAPSELTEYKFDLDAHFGIGGSGWSQGQMTPCADDESIFYRAHEVKALLALAASAAPSSGESADWLMCERIRSEDHVDEALRVFSQDSTHDNAVGAIQAALTVYLADTAALAAQTGESLPVQGVPDAWMRPDTKECTSAANKQKMERAGFGVWDQVAAQYTRPLYFAAPTGASK